MKQLFTAVFALVLFSLVSVAQPIPSEDGFRIGKLDNGLTYYLYHNENSKGHAEFYIAHNVGALQEEDSQNGLAHFLEHMAFNGTKHYPDKGVLEFLAKDGVRFGYNVNAYTSKTETVYNISAVPLVRESFVDSVLMVLHDWSCDISCEKEALDDERGVIHEEWRLRDESRYRMMCRQNELIYKGSKQPTRTVLGDMNVVLNFAQSDILDFYHKWYRPDLQAIIIVGDIDVDQMEKKVKTQFSDIPMPANAPAKETYKPAPQDGPMYANMLDHQIQYQAVKIIYKQPFPSYEERGTFEYQKDLLSRQIITSILGSRLKEGTKDPSSDVKSAVAITNPDAPIYFITLLTLSPKGKTKLSETFEYGVTQVERLLRFGISKDELDVAKFELSRRYHLNVNDSKDDQKNADIVEVCIDNFLRGYPCVTPVEMKEVIRQALDEITAESIKDYPVKMFKESEAIYSNCLNNDLLSYAPDEAKMKQIVAKVQSEKLEPKFMTYKMLSLEADPKPGSIVREKELKDKDIKVLTLSNGVKVYWTKAEPVKGDTHLSMEYVFETGYRAFPQDKLEQSVFAIGYVKRYTGFNDCDRFALNNQPVMDGLRTMIWSKNKDKATLTVSSNSSKIEDAFRFGYLQLTNPCFGTEASLEKTKQDELSSLALKEKTKDIFNRKMQAEQYDNHPWLNITPDSAAIKSVNMDVVKDIFHRTYGKFSDMSVFICSDHELDELIPLINKYIASLEEDYHYKVIKDKPLVPKYKGKEVVDEVYPHVSEPVTNVSFNFLSKIKLTNENRAKMEYVDYIMSARYLNQIREARGGTYHVSFRSEMYPEKGDLINSKVAFQTRPAMKDVLVQDVEDEMEKICKDGPDETEMLTATKYLVKHRNEYQESVKKSITAQKDLMLSYIMFGLDYNYDYAKVVESVDAESIRKICQKLNSGDKFVSIYTEQ